MLVTWKILNTKLCAMKMLFLASPSINLWLLKLPNGKMHCWKVASLRLTDENMNRRILLCVRM